MARCSKLMKRAKYILLVLIYVVLYLADVFLDVGIINRLCCHHKEHEWYQIVNPIYCGMSFSLTYISSIICNAFAFKEFLVEFKQKPIRMVMAVLAMCQLLPFIWFMYCVGIMCCDCYPSSTERLMLATYTVRMFEALFEGMGQMCLQSYMVMERKQNESGIVDLTFEECRNDNVNSSTILEWLKFTRPDDSDDLFDGKLIELSIAVSLLTVCFTIIRWADAHMKRGYLWIAGYTSITVLTVGTRVYILSTLGTFWDTEKFGSINFYWLAPIFAGIVASMFYACIRHIHIGQTSGVMKYLKRSIAGTCDFVSPDGIPSSAAYFICSLVFIIYFRDYNPHLYIGLALSVVLLLTNIRFAFIYPEAIFRRLFEDETPGINNDRINILEHIELENRVHRM